MIKEFEDLRGRNLSGEDLKPVGYETLITTWFDTETKWPSNDCLPESFDPNKVMEEGKNPGLGVRELHERGIDGRGVHVAVIDQKIDILDHDEYKDCLVDYREYGEAANEPYSMHGPAVLSLLAGKTCGVVPRAKVTFKATPSERSFKEETNALLDIMEINKGLVDKDKVRIVSVSKGYREDVPEPGLKEWVVAIREARKSGIIFIDVNTPFYSCASHLDKDDYDSYELAYDYRESKKDFIDRIIKNSVLVPSDHRTYASWKVANQYEYTGRGGSSWSVPYFAGVIAIVLQISPHLKTKEIEALVSKGFTLNKKGLKVINPTKIVKLAENTKK